MSKRGAEQATRSTSLERDVCQMRKHRHLPKTTQLKCGRTQASAQEWMTPKLEFLTSTLYGFPSNPRWTRAWCLRGKDRVELLSLLTHGHDDSHSPCLCYHWVCTASQHVLAFQINHFPDTGPLTFLHAYESSGRKGELLGFFFLSFLLFFFLETVRGLGTRCCCWWWQQLLQSEPFQSKELIYCMNDFSSKEEIRTIKSPKGTE